VRVIFNTYPWAFAMPGGGEIQLLKYAEHLPAHAVEIVWHDIWKPEFDTVEAVHFFSCIQGSEEFCNYVKRRGLPLVVSSSLWITQATTRDFPIAQIRAQLALADVIVPNSAIEADMLATVLDLPRERFMPVMNGVDVRFAHPPDQAVFRARFGIAGPFLLTVGNIETRKNQLNLVRALPADGSPLVIVGNIREPRYAQRVFAEGGSRLRFLGPIGHDDPLPASAYAACSAFVLPSMLETPGLAALEAAAAGAPVVITSEGSTREYFRDMVHYVDPAEPDDIRRKIEIALAAGSNPGLNTLVTSRFTWPTVTAALAEVYAIAISRNRVSAS
jgi:glycosyltransferase involved in cell wall biosynthesis